MALRNPLIFRRPICGRFLAFWHLLHPRRWRLDGAGGSPKCDAICREPINGNPRIPGVTTGQQRLIPTIWLPLGWEDLNRVPDPPEIYMRCIGEVSLCNKGRGIAAIRRASLASIPRLRMNMATAVRA